MMVRATVPDFFTLARISTLSKEGKTFSWEGEGGVWLDALSGNGGRALENLAGSRPPGIIT